VRAGRDYVRDARATVISRISRTSGNVKSVRRRRVRLSCVFVCVLCAYGTNVTRAKRRRRRRRKAFDKLRSDGDNPARPSLGVYICIYTGTHDALYYVERGNSGSRRSGLICRVVRAVITISDGSSGGSNNNDTIAVETREAIRERVILLWYTRGRIRKRERERERESDGRHVRLRAASLRWPCDPPTNLARTHERIIYVRRSNM